MFTCRDVNAPSGFWINFLCFVYKSQKHGYEYFFLRKLGRCCQCHNLELSHQKGDTFEDEDLPAD